MARFSARGTSLGDGVGVVCCRALDDACVEYCVEVVYCGWSCICEDMAFCAGGRRVYTLQAVGGAGDTVVGGIFQIIAL